MGGTMKARILMIVGALISLGGSIAVAQQSDAAAPGKITATINAQQVSAPISKYLYGGFIEHGGMLMYRSLWSELIDDRKFYFPITSVEPLRRHVVRAVVASAEWPCADGSRWVQMMW